jgi:hypothetical protein
LILRNPNNARFRTTLNSFGQVIPEHVSGGTKFNPDGVSGLVNWWNLADQSRVFSEFDPAIVLGKQDDLIKLVNDRKMNHGLFGQGPLGAGPVLHEGVFNPYQALWFNGNNSQMATGISTNATNATIFVVYHAMSTNGRYMLFYEDSLGKFLLTAENTPDSSSLAAGTPTYRLDGVPTDLSTRALLFSATNNRLNVVTMENVNLSAWSQSSTGFRVGLYGGPGSVYAYRGYLCEILIYNGPLSSTNRDTVEQYLLRRWRD